MDKDLSHIEEIEAYLAGELDPAHRKEFEKKISEDSNFREELNSAKQVIDALQGYAFKQMIQDIQEKHSGDTSE